jgi:hypothetical protein
MQLISLDEVQNRVKNRKQLPREELACMAHKKVTKKFGAELAGSTWNSYIHQ